MEECAINMPHTGRSEKFPPTCHPQRTSSAQAIDQEGCSSVPSSPTPSDQGDTTHHSDAVLASFEKPSSEINGNDYRALCIAPLLQAAMKGDWPAAKTFLKKYPDCVKAPITKGEATALHIAAAAQQTTFIKKLLKLMDPDDLKLKTNYGFTALHSAAQVGNVRIAEQLVKSNKKPLLIHDVNDDTPLIVAAYLGHANMVSYLFSLTGLEQLTHAKRIDLLCHTIYNDLYDIALKILEMDPNMVTADCAWEALEMLARKPFAIGSESQLSFWKSLLKSC